MILSRPNPRRLTATAALLLLVGAGSCGGGSGDTFVNVTWAVTCPTVTTNPPCFTPTSHRAIGENGDVDPLGRTLHVSCTETRTSSGTIVLSFEIDAGDGATLSGTSIYLDPDTGELLDECSIVFEDGGIRYSAIGGTQAPTIGQECQLTTFLREGRDYMTTIECANVEAEIIVGDFRSLAADAGGPITLELANCRSL